MATLTDIGRASLNDQPAEGPRDVIDRELARAEQKDGKPTTDAAGSHTAAPATVELAPGDDAVPGTPGTGENVCRVCHGDGQVEDRPCANCGGRGRVVTAIGGA